MNLFGLLISLSRPSTNKFATRINSGQVVAKYPAHLDASPLNFAAAGAGSQVNGWSPQIRVVKPPKPLQADSKYMFGRLFAKRDVIDRHINGLTEILADSLQLVSTNNGSSNNNNNADGSGDGNDNENDADDWKPNCRADCSTFLTTGRICCDASGSGARLNAASLLLQGNCDVSSGVSVQLCVDQVKEYSFFPGQVVAVKATNPTGNRLVATAIIQPPIDPVVKVEAPLFDKQTGNLSSLSLDK